MNFSKFFKIKELWTNSLNQLGQAWWVEIVTENPRCTYYFGPFPNYQEASTSQSGYIEDLENEGAQGIKVVIKRCKPSYLTIEHDLGERFDRQITGYLSGQY